MSLMTDPAPKLPFRRLILMPWRWEGRSLIVAAICWGVLYLASCPIVLQWIRAANYPEPARSIAEIVYSPIIVSMELGWVLRK